MTVTFELLPESARWGHSLSLFRRVVKGPRFDQGRDAEPVYDRVRTVTIPIQEYDTGLVRLRVAFDPETQTLYLGQGDDGHALRRAQDQAWEARRALATVRAQLDRLKGDRPSGVRRRAMGQIRRAVDLALGPRRAP